MTFVALDLSIRSTGFALWGETQPRPVSGTWALGSLEYSARAFVRLHRNLLDLHRVNPIDELTFEEPPPTHQMGGHTNAATEAAKYGLVGHAMSFAEALGIRWRPVNIASWRKHFIGSMPRGTKAADLKHMAMKRCRELGFEPTKHDEAEALGLLDYSISLAGIIAPWRENVLQRELTVAGDGRRAVNA